MCENNWLKHLSSERFLQRTFFCMFYHMSNNGETIITATTMEGMQRLLKIELNNDP